MKIRIEITSRMAAQVCAKVWNRDEPHPIKNKRKANIGEQTDSKESKNKIFKHGKGST